MNDIIIKVESGIVADIYFTEPLNVTIVDYDAIEGGETFEDLMKKAVITMTPDTRVGREHIEDVIKSLVLECRRPGDRRSGKSISGKAAA